MPICHHYSIAPAKSGPRAKADLEIVWPVEIWSDLVKRWGWRMRGGDSENHRRFGQWLRLFERNRKVFYQSRCAHEILSQIKIDILDHLPFVPLWARSSHQQSTPQHAAQVGISWITMRIKVSSKPREFIERKWESESECYDWIFHEREIFGNIGPQSSLTLILFLRCLHLNGLLIWFF